MDDALSQQFAYPELKITSRQMGNRPSWEIMDEINRFIDHNVRNGFEVSVEPSRSPQTSFDIYGYMRPLRAEDV